MASNTKESIRNLLGKENFKDWLRFGGKVCLFALFCTGLYYSAVNVYKRAKKLRLRADEADLNRQDIDNQIPYAPPRTRRLPYGEENTPVIISNSKCTKCQI